MQLERRHIYATPKIMIIDLRGFHWDKKISWKLKTKSREKKVITCSGQTTTEKLKKTGVVPICVASSLLGATMTEKGELTGRAGSRLRG